MFEFGMRIKLAVLRLLVLACVGFGMAAGAGATPVTLRFEARVASIILRNGGSQHIPETVIGDSVSIVFSFNDPSVEINNPQQYSIVLRLSDKEFVAPNFSITVRDQADRNIPLNGSIADPANTPEDDRPVEGVSDSLWIGSIAGSSGGFDTLLSGIDGEVEWSAPILFAGNESILNQVAIPVDPAVWEAMEYKELALEFTDIGTSNSTRIGAFIHAVSKVPEPSGATILMVTALIWGQSGGRGRLRGEVAYGRNRCLLSQ